MTMTSARRAQIAASLRDKEYRDIVVSEEIDTGLPFQIRAMRQDRGWSQKELAERLGMTQEGVSRLESLSYGKFTIATLKRLASAFDVALAARFIPFSLLVDWTANFSPEDLAVPDYEHDEKLFPVPVRMETTQATDAYAHLHTNAVGVDILSTTCTPVPRIRFVAEPVATRGWNAQTTAPSDYLLAQTGD